MEYGTTTFDGRSLKRVTVSGSMDYLKPTTTSRVDDDISREKKKGALRETVAIFGDTTTAHGLPLIINGTHTVSRLVWTVIWLVAFGVACAQSIQLLTDFFIWPTTVNIELVTETNLAFPAVTVCNMNRMRRSELVGTRFEGLIAVDGGIQGGDYDYSWFFDWSSTSWFNQWQSSSSSSAADTSSASNGNTGATSVTGDENSSQVQSSTGGESLDAAGNESVSSSVELPEATQSGSSPSPSPDLNTQFTPLDTTMEYLSTAAVTPNSSPPTEAAEASGASVGGSSSGASSVDDGSASSSNTDRRRRSAAGDSQSGAGRRRRNLPSSSSSSNFDWWDSYDFEYENYYDWEGVDDENDWRGFYARSTAEDFSDMVDVANPTREELERLGHQAQDFILQCTFDKRNCSYRDFQVFQNREYGNCFTFNHGRDNDTIRRTSRFGAKYGLHLTLFIEQPEYMGIFSPESGARVAVHDQDTKPIPEDNGITTAAGLATSIGVRQDYIQRLGLPYGNCSDGTDTDFNSTEADGYGYSISACNKYCLQRAMFERCNCVTDILIDYAPKCSYINTTQQTCRRAVENLYESGVLECKCPTACSEISYKLSVSSSRWPSERYEEHLHSRISAVNAKAARLMQNVEQTRKNLVRLRIYFEELNYQSIIQSKKYTIETLLGSLGGLFGLYIGFSVITISEVVVFFFRLIKVLVSWGHRPGNGVKPVVY